MRLQGRVPSGLEALLRTAPMAYHLIKWGQLLHEEAAALPVAQPRPRLQNRRSESEPLRAHRLAEEAPPSLRSRRVLD